MGRFFLVAIDSLDGRWTDELPNCPHPKVATVRPSIISRPYVTPWLSPTPLFEFTSGRRPPSQRKDPRRCTILQVYTLLTTLSLYSSECIPSPASSSSLSSRPLVEESILNPRYALDSHLILRLPVSHCISLTSIPPFPKSCCLLWALSTPFSSAKSECHVKSSYSQFFLDVSVKVKKKGLWGFPCGRLQDIAGGRYDSKGDHSQLYSSEARSCTAKSSSSFIQLTGSSL